MQLQLRLVYFTFMFSCLFMSVFFYLRDVCRLNIFVLWFYWLVYKLIAILGIGLKRAAFFLFLFIIVVHRLNATGQPLPTPVFFTFYY